jgi:tryptophan synthase alpha chain
MITKPAFVGYLTLGDGGLDYSVEAALALEKGGVDLLEIGIPFSDPIADGPSIAQAMQRSLAQGTKPTDALVFIERIRRHSKIPLVLFSYYNPIFQAGDGFLQALKEEGANGILILDQPLEEANQKILPQIFIASPSTTDQRLKTIAAKTEGFLYYVCQKGVTGMRDQLPSFVAQDLQRIKAVAHTPVVAGFGISNAKMAKEILRYADGFVVGSYFVKEMGKQVPVERLTQLAKEIDPREKV